MVHMNRPSTPWLATMPATITTNAPVGPPICTREPPSAEIRKPATIAVVDAGLRRQPGGDREGHRERQGDQADGHAGDEVAGGLAAIVVGQCQPQLRGQTASLASRQQVSPWALSI